MHRVIHVLSFESIPTWGVIMYTFQPVWVHKTPPLISPAKLSVMAVFECGGSCSCSQWNVNQSHFNTTARRKVYFEVTPQWQNDCRELCGSFTHEICRGWLAEWRQTTACYVIVYLQIWVCTTTYFYKGWLSFTSKHLCGFVPNYVTVWKINVHFHSASQLLLTTPTCISAEVLVSYATRKHNMDSDIIEYLIHCFSSDC